MENNGAIIALAALAQNTRPETLRLLVRHEPDGIPAGELARLLDVPQNTMSAHLATLCRAGLVKSERQSRSIIYRADLDGLRDLTLFLLKTAVAVQRSLRSPDCRTDAMLRGGNGPMLSAISLHEMAGSDARLHEALRAADLPTDDIEDEGRAFLEAVFGDGQTMGYAGLERCAGDCLLRSVVVLPEDRGRGSSGQSSRQRFEKSVADAAIFQFLGGCDAADVHVWPFVVVGP